MAIRPIGFDSTISWDTTFVFPDGVIPACDGFGSSLEHDTVIGHDTLLDHCGIVGGTIPMDSARIRIGGVWVEATVKVRSGGVFS